MRALTALVPLGIVLAALSGLASSGSDQPPAVQNEVIIRPGESGCVVQSVAGPEVTEVRQVVLPQLELGPADATTERVRKALVERYGPRISESSTPMHYVWVWDKVLEQWILVCMSASEFNVDFGARGSVVVESHDREFVGEKPRDHSPSGA